MIKSVSIINYRNERLDMILDKPELSGFVIRKIDGLGAAKANVNITDIITTDGGIFNSARLSSRNIVLDLIFFGNDIEEIRQRAYKYFPIKKELTFIVKTDYRELEISGYVETNEPNIFSEQEGTNISIICPNPYFYSKNSNYTVFAGVEPSFEFPFSNESLTEPLLIMSEIQNKTENVIYYSGDSDVGVTMHIHCIGGVGDITIWNVNTRQKMIINATKVGVLLNNTAFKSLDDILIKTERGDKGIYLIREGVFYNILGALDPGSEWLRIHKGDNIYAFTATSGVENLQFRVENKILYEGI
jgi:hypothetical protein|nr:MAG TPA: tail protein [Caudoviricetes sp.]